MTEFSYQLYSSRNFPPLADTLRMLADLGYAEVEGFGALLNDPETVAVLKDGLAETGLGMPTSHVDLEVLAESPSRVIAIAQSLGIQTLFGPHVGPPERPTDAAGWAAFGKRLGELGKPLWDAGIGFGWHNHDFEMADLGGEDRPLDLILQGHEALQLELDIAWVQVGGQDPIAWMTKYSDRLHAVHVKDIAPQGECADEDGWADVGHGVMDWSALMGAARQTSAQHFVMEHDNPSDHHRFASRSLTSARTC